MDFKLNFIVLLLLPTTIYAINLESLIGDLMQGGGPDLKTLQNVYSILPQEVRDKFTKDLLQNPGKVGKDVLNMFGPQLESMVSNFIQGSSGSSSSNNVEYDDTSNPTYGAGAKGPKVGGTGVGGAGGNGGFDWSPLTSMVGNLISQNPQMMLSMASGLIQNTKDGINLDSLGNMISENFDINTVLTIAQSLGITPGKNKNQKKRGEGEPNEPSLMELLKINELLKMWKNFINSPIGRRANFIVPRLLKSESIEDALRLLERETGFNFNMILLQLEDRTLRNALIAQLVQPVTNLLRTIEFPVDDFKTVQKKIDELFFKLGYQFKSSETIEPMFAYIRDRFKLAKGSVYELSVGDIETILNDILLNEVLEPMKLVTRAYANSRGNAGCTTFIYCQLNYNFYNENFLKKNVIRLSSIISGFQVSKVVRNTFSEVYESISRGAEGKDCTRGVQSHCLDLMNTAHHNEL